MNKEQYANMVVLLVDDEPAILDLMSYRITKKVGAKVLTANNGAEAILELYKADRVDLIITDISMPGMTGIEMLHHIRKKGDKIPIIILTGIGDTSEIEVDLLLNESSFAVTDNHFLLTRAINKPSSEEETVKAVTSALDWILSTRLDHSHEQI